jgi:hypothetical protein
MSLLFVGAVIMLLFMVFMVIFSTVVVVVFMVILLFVRIFIHVNCNQPNAQDPMFNTTCQNCSAEQMATPVRKSWTENGIGERGELRQRPTQSVHWNTD